MPLITGVLAEVNVRTIKLAGIDDWPGMPDDFFRYGTRKRVSRDKKKCTLSYSASTTINANQNGETVALADIVSCRVAVEFVVKKYSIHGVEGWTLSAKIITPI